MKAPASPHSAAGAVPPDCFTQLPTAGSNAGAGSFAADLAEQQSRPSGTARMSIAATSTAASTRPLRTLGVGGSAFGSPRPA